MNVEAAYTLVMYALVLASLAFLLDAAGRAQRRAIEALRGEVGERRRAQQELERSNRDLEQFAYVASHDLKEPLRSVTSSLERVAEQHAGGPEGELVADAVDSAHRMKTLIDDLLSYARLSTGETRREPVQVGSALEEACRNLGPVLEESGARIVWSELPTVEADRSGLVQLLQNLVSNAVKFRGPDPPRVEIGARASEGFWGFTVRDNGIGMDARDCERVFELFERLHAPGDFPGSGIGLSTCKRIVERQGGRIWVESSPGEGARFHFTLLRAQEEAPERAAPDVPSEAAVEGADGAGTLRILLVEDSQADAAMAKQILADAGPVEHCTTLADALARLEDPARPAPSLVLLDLSLPDGRGLSVLDRLARANPPPIVVMSGDEDPARARAAIERGVRSFIVKGETPPTEVLRLVREAAGVA